MCRALGKYPCHARNNAEISAPGAYTCFSSGGAALSVARCFMTARPFAASMQGESEEKESHICADMLRPHRKKRQTAGD